MQAAVGLVTPGGVTTLDDTFAGWPAGLAGCIIGRALYPGDDRPGRTASGMQTTVPRAGGPEAPRGDSATPSARIKPTTTQNTQTLTLQSKGPFDGEVSSRRHPQHRLLWTQISYDNSRRQDSDEHRHNSTGAKAWTTGTSISTSTTKKNCKYSSGHGDPSTTRKHFNLIDTPGHPDFIGQTIGVLRYVDTAAIVINASSGIEVNTRRLRRGQGCRHPGG